MYKPILAVIALAALSGCAVLPNALRLTPWHHLSHPTVGRPLAGHALDKRGNTVEDCVDESAVSLIWGDEDRGLALELGLGWQWYDCGFKGPPLTGEVRVSHKINFKNW